MTTTDAATMVDQRGATAPGRSIGLAVLRVTLGVIVLVAWFDNLGKDLYTADGLTGFIDYLFSEEGNNSSLGFYQSILDGVVVPAAGVVSKFQLVTELGIGIGLILGVFTRFFSLAAVIFFITVFLGYFGGNEWIWTYVLLIASSLAVFLGYAGRSFGVDQFLAKARGASPFGLIW
jgi:uncharacterized membrane protein YphA (DoxX/SURF4 family)